MIKFTQLFSWLLKKQDQDSQVLTEDSEYQLEQDLQRLALNKVFQQNRFSMLDGLNEYDDDFTSFSARGELITHDMLRTAKRSLEQQQKTIAATGEPVILDDGQDDSKSA